jgi:hypothetical protein
MELTNVTSSFCLHSYLRTSAVANRFEGYTARNTRMCLQWLRPLLHLLT